MLPGTDGLTLCRWIRERSDHPVIMLTARGEEADRIDVPTREVHKAGTALGLTAKEFDLLWFLASHPRKVFSRDQLMDRVWGYEAAFDTGTVTVHVRRLRQKIEEDPSRPKFLETVWGVGYRFVP
jgi:DNA-binding response OmpR family regulator